MEQDNPFEQFRQPDPEEDANPFEQFRQPDPVQAPVATAPAPSVAVPPAVENPLPSAPEDMPVITGNHFADYQRNAQGAAQNVTPEQAQTDQDELNKMRNDGEFDRGNGTDPSSLPEINTLQSQSDLYDPIRNKPEYKPVKDLENSWGYSVGPNITTPWGNEYALGAYVTGALPSPGVPKDVTELRDKRDIDLWEKYLTTGKEDTIGGIIPVRTQEKRENNPSFNATQPESDSNPAMMSTRYIVDPPDATAFERAAYQINQNIVGGVFDAALEGKLTGEGVVGKALPETVPNEFGEKFATDMTTFALGGIGAEKLGAGGMSLANKAFKMVSPEAVQSIRKTYAETLRVTGDASLARRAAAGTANGVVMGLGLGVRTTAMVGKVAGMGLAEGVVSPKGSEGGVIDSKYLQRTFGWTKERADDFSFMADSPAISGVLGSLGALRNTAVERVIKPAFGGLRNMSPMGFNLQRLRMSDRSAGIKFLTWLDPGIAQSAPETAIQKMKLLADSVKRNGIKQFQLMKAGRDVTQDTATAFDESAAEYFRTAYADKAPAMNATDPNAFDNWVKQQAGKASGNLYKLRTAIGADGTASKGVEDLKDLLFDAAENTHPEGLVAGQREGAQVAGQTHLDELKVPEGMIAKSKKELDVTKSAADNAMTDDSEFQKYLATANNDLGSRSKQQGIIDNQINPKVYGALEKLKTDSDSAYEAISKTGAEGDPVSILNIIKKTGSTGPGDVPLGQMGPPSPKTTIHDPFLKQVAESVEANPSIDNIYNKVRNQISEQIQVAERGGDPMGRLETLKELRDNINNDQLQFVADNGDGNIKAMVEDAKGKYIKLKNAFYSNRELTTVANEGTDAIKAANRPIKDRENFDIALSRHINSGLNTTEKETFRKSLINATKEGGQDITPELHTLFASKAVNNLADTISRGGKQDVNTLRTSLRDIVENLEGLGSPHVAEFKRMESKIQTLQNTVKDKEELHAKVVEAAKDLQEKAEDSILARFVTKSEGGKVPIEGGDFGNEISGIVRGEHSVSKVKQLMNKADSMGETGVILRDAAQGSYVRYLQKKMESGSKMDMIPPGQKFAKRSNDRAIDVLFDPTTNEHKVMEMMFRDKPETIQALNKVADTYSKLSKKTPMVDQKALLGPLPRSEDPAQAAQSLITFMLGQLNPTATKVKRITTPMSIESLEQVKERRAELMHLLLESPDHFQKLTKQIIDDKVEEETSKWVARTLRRGMAREYQADPSVGIGTVASGAAGSLFDETSKLIKTGVSKTMK